MGELLNSIMLYSGIRSDVLAIASEPVDIVELIDVMLSKMRHQFDMFNIEVEKDVPDDIEPIMGNREALLAALHNIVFNAVKHGGTGGWIRVSARMSDGNRELLIKVEDKGSGIEKQDMRYIFEPFYRGSKAISDQMPGTGFGLSLAKKVILSHRGRISVVSQKGKGTCFTVKIPYQRGKL